MDTINSSVWTRLKELTPFPKKSKRLRVTTKEIEILFKYVDHSEGKLVAWNRWVEGWLSEDPEDYPFGNTRLVILEITQGWVDSPDAQKLEEFLRLEIPD